MIVLKCKLWNNFYNVFYGRIDIICIVIKELNKVVFVLKYLFVLIKLKIELKGYS